MHFLLIGASGRTGLLVLEDALNEGHRVTALVRNPASLPAASDHLRIVQGTPTKFEDVEKAISGEDAPDAVIVTLNAPRASDSPFAKPIVPPRFMADCVANVRKAMAMRGVKKIVIMSAFGVGESFKNLNCLMKPVISYTNMGVQFEDHNMVYNETKQSELDWVFARPAMLKDGDELSVKEFGTAGEGTSFMPSITKKSVANWLVHAAEGDKWNRRAIVITN